MTSLARRLVPMLAAAVAGGALVVATATPASAAFGTATPTPTSIPNTATAQIIAITNSVPVPASPVVEIVGPASGSDTYTGSNPSSNGSSATFNLDPNNLPAAPGTYTLNVCSVSCALPLDSGSITVTGAAPKPVHTQIVAEPGGSAVSIAIPGTGFAKGASISVLRPTPSSNDANFTEDNATSTATSLKGSLSIGSGVPPGVYDLLITDTAGHTGICAGCLEATGASGGPGPVTGLTVTAPSANTASARWSAPTTGTTATSYSVVVSKTSQTATDSGITVTVSGTTAAVSGLAQASTYYLTVTASDGTHSGLPAVKRLETPNPSVLSLAASRTSIVARQGVTLSGFLAHTVGSNTKPLPGQTVIITAKSEITKKVTMVGEVPTGSQGNFSITVFPKTNQTYGAYFPGDSGGGGTPDAPAFSNAFPKVNVAPVVVAAAQHTKLRKGAKVYVLGYVYPNEHGRTVTLVRIDGTGKVHTIARATLRAGSHYAVRGKLPRARGVYSLQVRITKRIGNLAGHSATFKVRRK